jgi:hypothetical protein
VKPLIVATAIAFSALSCSRQQKPIVSQVFIDSLIDHYTNPQMATLNDSVMAFWKNRINPRLPGLVSESKYASTLSMRFHFFGNIQDLKQADSVMKKVDVDYNHKEAQPNLTLVRYAIMQHRFKEADNYLQRARQIGLRPYDLLTTSFDVDFELGRYPAAGFELKQLNAPDDYGYCFRRSKMDHLYALLDSALETMLRAAALEPSSIYLKQLALASAGDLYIHASRLQQAADLYKQCIQANSADFHSLMGLGWIALVYDKNDSLAEKIFKFVLTKNKLPDPWLKLSQWADERSDPGSERLFAQEFERRATDPLYGNMYNKYMIELYTGILNDPAKAEIMAKKELANRATPQTFSWYAWTLFANKKKEEAYKVFQDQVSGKPLEGLELYWMGKLMQGLDKGYNAQQFFKAAYSNKYDLSPGMVRDLEKNLN